jgi:hypothetical protein
MNIFFLTENTVAEAQPKDRNVQAQYDPSVAALPQDDASFVDDPSVASFVQYDSPKRGCASE